ncbi:thioredoxin domain-containing protein [Devosia algicola]|uniref:Thioredoxin domain-containing protein n=1 Tax=Devosia algicola TaxID=3026418 RepID=A0ABY7YMK1_9HYPH|nr:thioredoxin domain-containing protein [Devosia algicola]WDR02531.1 thioredoxin domain-containing protein [Devosia algicola]
MKFNRRDTLVLASAAAAFGLIAPGVMAAEGDMIDTAKLMAPAGGWSDFPLGAEDAPVTVIEYASPTCPHCASFSNNVYPEFKKAYIDTGKVRFLLRPLMRGGQAGAIDAAIFMLAESAGPMRFHQVIETYYKTQPDWIQSAKLRDALQEIARQLGFSDEQFETTLKDVDGFNKLVAVRDQALNDFGLEGTPTFYIDGKTLSGDKSLEEPRR